MGRDFLIRGISDPKGPKKREAAAEGYVKGDWEPTRNTLALRGKKN